MRHILVVSDVHLCNVVPASEPWMRYRQREFLLDRELAALIDSSIAQADRDELEVVFNGDLFDFDAPDLEKVGINARFGRNEPGAVALIESILDDHPALVGAAGRALLAGGRVVFVSGNHDSQMTFRAVRKSVSARLIAAARAHGSTESLSVLGGRVLFRVWFHQVDGVHIEHGQQYDSLCGLNLLPSSDGFENTVGSLASHYLPALLSRLNPHSSDPFGVKASDVLKMIRQCALEGPIPTVHYAAAIAQMIRDFSTVSPERKNERELCAIASDETHTQSSKLERHTELFCARVSPREFIAQEKWKRYESSTEKNIRNKMLEIAKIYGCRAVVTSHTHRAFSDRKSDVFLANSGAWTPDAGMRDNATTPAGSFVWIVAGPTRLEGGTYYVPRVRA